MFSDLKPKTDFDTLISGPDFSVDHFRGCKKLYYTNIKTIAKRLHSDVHIDTCKDFSPLVDGLKVTPAGESLGSLAKTAGLG